MTTVLEEFKDIPKHSVKDLLPKEEDMPSVSVLTITKDRRAFIPLAKYCFLAQGYPEDKLEWVIVDDGKDQIKDLVSDLPNVKYVLCDESVTIGAKRNLAVKHASHDILVMMDDDDVYPNNRVITRVAYMLAGPFPRECVFSTTIPCFDIHEKKSFMNVPPMTLEMADRVSEATLAFTRDFWNHRGFPDQQIAEAGAFIRGREHMCRELSPQDVIVSLCHKKTTSSRKAPPGESNGCHYGFSEDLYTLVSEIAERI
jgi:glycosyltransferase involved in cell wall biosynthesis